MAKIRFLLIVFPIFFTACKDHITDSNILKMALSSKNPNIKRVMDSVERYEIQIRYTQIDRKDDSVSFSDYDFQVDKNNYFYPASTIKFPIAVLALERLNAVDSLNRNTNYYIEGDSIETTFAKDISQIFAISDNGANNRLMEFLGQDTINSKLHRKGIEPVRISHRVGYHTDDLMTKPLIIYLNDSTTAPTQPTQNTAAIPLKIDNLEKGTGFYDDGSLVHEPFDFGLKNYYPVTAQHALLKRIIFPEKFRPSERFNLSREQHDFLLETMHTLPKNIGYDAIEYYDGYCKFFLFGDTKGPIPDHIEIYNKTGSAYGTLTDCAYIKDEKNNVDFFLTATILVNKNGIFNDNLYEYDTVGMPFLAELGREIHKLEMNRKK
ncbi:serine hydrolase [Maribacter sp. 2304DJ31-5]|uniref:serine hydrolase n=1 Tax=Maribacter sp. 2304DJ31-5 TaxID=3386273 RepID=UPI0039BD27A1